MAIIPLSWDHAPVDSLAVSIAPIDELGFPISKRGLRVKLPTDPLEFETFAISLADNVRDTMMEIFREEAKRKPPVVENLD